MVFPAVLGIVWACLYGITMKIADLLDEHGLHWFKGDQILFGFLWGLFCSLAIITTPALGNAFLADVLAFLVRMRIDYRNHAIATAIVVLSFIMFSTFQPILFFSFFGVFVILGWIRDELDDTHKRTDWLQKIFEFSWYYIAAPLVYALLTQDWLLFFAFITYLVGYNVIKYCLEKSHHAPKNESANESKNIIA